MERKVFVVAAESLRCGFGMNVLLCDNHSIKFCFNTLHEYATRLNATFSIPTEYPLTVAPDPSLFVERIREAK